VVLAIDVSFIGLLCQVNLSSKLFGEVMTQSISGYNLALESLQAQEKAFDFTEHKIGQLIKDLESCNERNRDLQDLIASLTRARKEKKKADFSEDIAMQNAIDRIHEFAPRVFGTPVYIFEFEELETTLTLLDTSVKDQVSKINEITMYINQAYVDRLQYTENAQKMLDTLMRHNDSIISKTAAR